MADQRTPFLSIDLDSGGGVERAQGVNLRATGAGGSTELLGESAMALSLPVVIANDQTAIPVDLGANNDVVATGNVAHDAPDSGNPIKVGGRASTTIPAAVADDDRVDAIYTTQGAATVAGLDGTTPRALAVNASGQLEVDITAQQLSPIVVAGGGTHDGAVPGADDIGALIGLANAAAPTFTEGRQVLLSTNLAGALRVTGGGGGQEYVTDAASAGDSPYTGGLAVLIRDDVLSAQESADLDYTPSRANARGAQWVELDPTNPVVVTSEFDGSTAVATMADADANPDVLPIGAYLMGYNGATWDRLRTSIAAGLEVDISASVALDISAGATLTPGVGATDLGKAVDDPVGGTDTGVALLVQRNDTPAGLTPADNDYTVLRVDANGRLHVTDPNAGAGNPSTPTLEDLSATDTAAGATSDLDSVDFGADTRRLSQVVAWSSVAYKVEINSVDNAVETIIAVGGGQAFTPFTWEPPHANYGEVTWAGSGGFDGFRVSITNLDDSLAADVHAMIAYAD